MAFAIATLVFEVETGGSDSNGGGFDNGVGAPGTDYSQQAAAQVAYTDLVIGGTGSENQLTSAAHPFSSTSPGNVINITGGTGFTTGLYRILSVSGSTATMDQGIGTANSTGGTGNLGGAFATINKATAHMTVPGQITYVKGGTYANSGVNGPSPTAGNALSRMIGYTSTRGDNGQATIQLNTNNVTLVDGSGLDPSNALSWENFTFDGNNKTSSNGYRCSVSGYNQHAFINCIFKRFTGQYCIQAPDGVLNIQGCEFASNAFTTNYSGCIIARTGSGTGTGGGYNVTVSDSYFNGNSISSTNLAAVIWGQNTSLSVQNCIFYNNTGTEMDGIYLNNALTVNISNNDIHSNSRHGINIDSSASNANCCALPTILNNVITSNGGWWINGSFATSPTMVTINHNAYYNNTSGAKTGFTAGAGEVTLTGLPYVNAPTDFSLNSTSGQGLGCRGAGIPGTLGVSATVGTGYMDLGALPLYARICV
jgi:hypothetical protein